MIGRPPLSAPSWLSGGLFLAFSPFWLSQLEIARPSKLSILLKKRTPRTMKIKPASFYALKVSWPTPWYAKKNVQTKMTLDYSTTVRLAADVNLVANEPKALKQAAQIM